MPITLTEYQDKLFSTVDYVAANLIRPIDANSLIKTRYITSQGNDDESWIGYLRDDTRISNEFPSGVVDIWLITISGLRGLPQDQKGMVGGFNKPFSLYIDYFADYRQGLDFDDSNLSDIKTNSEREFAKKVFAFDFALENITDCLPNGVYIQDYDIRCSLRKFSSDTAHRAACVLNLLVTGNNLQ